MLRITYMDYMHSVVHLLPSKSVPIKLFEESASVRSSVHSVNCNEETGFKFSNTRIMNSHYRYTYLQSRITNISFFQNPRSRRYFEILERKNDKREYQKIDTIVRVVVPRTEINVHKVARRVSFP